MDEHDVALMRTGAWHRFANIFPKKFGIAAGFVLPRKSLEGLGIDSLASRDLLMGIKFEFGIDIPISVYDTFVTVRNLFVYVVWEMDKRQSSRRAKRERSKMSAGSECD